MIKRTSILFLFLTALQLLATPFKVATWNINSDRRAEEGTNIDRLFEGRFKLETRINAIMQTIKDEKPELLFLQEIDPQGWDKVYEALKAEGYHVHKTPYNANEKAFWLMTAINPGRFKFLDNGTHSLVNPQLLDPEQLHNVKNHEGNLNTDFHKMVAYAKIKDLKEGREFFTFNTHLGITWEHKVRATNELISTIREIAKGEPSLLAGDFNSFSDELLKEDTEVTVKYSMVPLKTQFDTLMSHMKTADLNSMTQKNDDSLHVLNHDGSAMLPSSFVFYLYDFKKGTLSGPDFVLHQEILDGKSQLSEDKQREFLITKLGNRYPFSGRFDHIFGQGFSEVPGTARIVIEDIYRYNPFKLAEDMLDGVIPPSDHLMLATMVDFAVQSND
ncbi:MAG: endonuclease/exonuclease/phosphatase family protein [Myxococcota bacterium]